MAAKAATEAVLLEVFLRGSSSSMVSSLASNSSRFSGIWEDFFFSLRPRLGPLAPLSASQNRKYEIHEICIMTFRPPKKSDLYQVE